MARFSKKQILIGVWAIPALIVIIVAIASSGGSKTNPQTASKATAPKSVATAPVKLSTADLKTQSVKLLTDATSNYENLYSKVLADSALTDAVNANSDFYKDKRNFDTTPDMSGYNAYKKASDDYTTAKQNPPASLDTWNTDSSQLFTDINNYAQDKYMVLVDQRNGGSATSTHTAKVSADEQAYASDLAKTKADIAQL